MLSVNTTRFNALRYPADRWQCPDTGITCRKGLHEWEAWRAAVLRWGTENPEQCLAACKASFPFFCNAFLWTYKPLTSAGGVRRPTKGEKGRPFLTWPVQDKAAAEIIECIETGKSAAIRKSRDMGATWLLLAIAVWFLLFHSQVAQMIVSRVENDVDKDGDPDTLFAKVDYMLELLPPWMVGTIERSHLHIKSARTQSVIDGRPMTANLARGGRRHWIMVDEAAAIDNLEAVDTSSQDSTTCRIFNSTPKGGTYFGRLCRSGKVRLIVLPWWDHPEKGAAGRAVTIDPRTKKAVVDGPWRQASIAGRLSPRDIAENIDMDEEGAGAAFFDMGTLTRQTATYVHTPLYVGSLELVCPPNTVLRWESWITNREYRKLLGRLNLNTDVPDPKLKLWCDLEQDEWGNWRPSQAYSYTIGADPAAGVSAANAALSIFNKDLGTKVGEYADPNIPPDKLADLAVWLQVWFGGRTRVARLCWESNGVVGRQMTTRLRGLNADGLYMERIKTGKTDKQTERLGFHSSPETKVDMLTAYRTALGTDQYKNPSEEALVEAGRYVYTDAGGIDAGDNVGAEGVAKKTHGDIVVADALSWQAAINQAYRKEPERQALPGSVQHELNERKKLLRQERGDALSY